MVLKVNEAPCRMASWWLTNAEAADPELNTALRASIREYQKAGYITATFRSGREDLEENTKKLMRHNFELQSKANLAPIDGGEAFFVSNGLIYIVFWWQQLYILLEFRVGICYNVAIEIYKRSWQQ